MFIQDMNSQIILASASPRRQELLKGLGLQFKVSPANCDERILDGEPPEGLVRRLALLKAKTIARDFPRSFVIGADTTVVLDGEFLNKPNDAREAESMLGRLSGRTHQVWGAFAIFGLSAGIEHCEAHMSHVEFEDIPQNLIPAYVASGEPLDKAGAYAVQGLGAAFVRGVNGSYTNVVGLNLSALVTALLKFKALHLP